MFCVFMGILFSVGPPGAPSFVARRKIGEKGVPKGSKAALWNLAFHTGVRRGDVRASYEFALVQLTRFRPVRGVLRTASTDSVVLLQLRRIRWNLENNRRSANLAVGWLHKIGCLSGQRSTQRQGNKRSAAADLIASNAPLRDGSHKARQNGPKHYPRGFKGIAIPLARLSPLSFAVQRKMESPRGVRLAERQVIRRNLPISPPQNPVLPPGAVRPPKPVQTASENPESSA